MKICRYDNDRLGIVIGDKVHDVSAAQEEIRRSAPYDMMGDCVIAALPQWRGRLEELAKKAPGKAISDVKFLPPVARYSKVMAAPTNYHAHIAEMAARQGTAPEAHRGIQAAGIFLKANSSIVGENGNIKLRFPERLNEHELELVMIIGKEGTKIPYDKALDYVAGYCMGIDMTVRGKEDRSFRKSIDGYSPVGPWIVTADEIPDPDNLELEIPKLIEHLSTWVPLAPGDVIVSGTPGGVGARREPPVWMKPGDVVEIEVDKVGVLVNTIADD